MYKAAETGNISRLEALISTKVQLDAHRDTKTQYTALHAASVHGHLKAVELLLGHGAQVSATDVHGQTPLHLAARGGHLQCIQHLLKSGANLTVTDSNGHNPLYNVLVNGHEFCIEAIIPTETLEV